MGLVLSAGCEILRRESGSRPGRTARCLRRWIAFGRPTRYRYADGVANFFMPIGLPRAAFEALVLRIDDGVRRHLVALVLNEDFPYRALHILNDSFNLGDVGVDDDPEEVVYLLDQILVFAFEDAPDEVIRSWAKENDETRQDEAVSRVLFVRNNMINVGKLWSAKSNSLTPPVTAFKYDVVRGDNGAPEAVVVYLAATRIDDMGRPDRTDSTRLRVQLWPADLQLIIDELEHVRNRHFALDDEVVNNNGSHAISPTHSHEG